MDIIVNADFSNAVDFLDLFTRWLVHASLMTPSDHRLIFDAASKRFDRRLASGDMFRHVHVRAGTALNTYLGVVVLVVEEADNWG